MKVLMINTEMNRGGAAKMAATLVKAVDRISDDVCARLVHCEDNIVSEYCLGIKKPLAYYANVLQTRFLGSHRIYDFGVAKQILEMSKSADVIHLHNLHGYYLNFVELLSGLSDKPVVWTWHDMWGATGRCGVAMDCNDWNNGCMVCGHKNYYPKVLIDNASSEFLVKSQLYSSIENLHIVSPSAWMRNIAIERGFDPNIVTIIPNPIDISAYMPLDKMKAKEILKLENKEVLLFVAHNCNDVNKGYDDFIKIVNETGIAGMVVGVPPSKCNSDIKYLGKLTNQKDLVTCYSAADAFVITSKLDNYPNTVIESLACGTPVFGYSVGGISSQLANDWDGLAEYGDYMSISKKITQYLANNRGNSNLQTEISEYAKSKWDSSIIAKEYLNVYNKALS